MLSSPKKKELAAYYTPSQVSDILCDLAIKSPNEVILEPSFGGCSFLESSWRVLSKVGSQNPQAQIYGCDIDQFAFKNLGKNFPRGVKDNFLHKDFLKTSTEDFGQSFTTIIGNPPYLPVSKISNKKLAWKIGSNGEFEVPKKSSLWVYFIVHSLEFLQPSGNLFFIVPNSLVFTDYGKQLLTFLKQKFSEVSVLQFDESLFLSSGTKERTSFLICRGYGQAEAAEIVTVKYNNLEDVEANRGLRGRVEMTNEIAQVKTDGIEYVKLGEIADVRIGIVTGANKHLLKKEKDLKQLKLRKNYHYPILSKNKDLQGLSIERTEVATNVKSNQTFKLIAFDNLKSNKNEFLRIKKTIPAGTLNNATFTNRATSSKEWYQYDDRNKPDLFLLYHTKGGPRMVVNDADVNCTNSIHRVFLKSNRTPSRKKLLAVAFLSSLTKRSIKKNCRIYNSQLLKLEPGGAKNVVIPIPQQFSVKDLNNVFTKIDECCRRGNLKEATRLANRFIFRK